MEALLEAVEPLRVGIEAAELGGTVQREFEWDEARMKSRQQYVTEADVRAEQEIKDHIADHFPEHAFRGEEEGEEGESTHVWHIDPIDGTTDFVYGLPHSSVSVGLVVDGVREVGVVHHPNSETTYAAVRGEGAYRDGELISVTDTTEIDQALFGAGFSWHDAGDERILEAFEFLVSETLGIRRYGSSALNLCYAADGTFDGFIHRNLGTWDVAAGTLILEEAGGRVTDFDGRSGDDVVLEGDIVATSPDLHEQLAFLDHRS